MPKPTNNKKEEMREGWEEEFDKDFLGLIVGLRIEFFDVMKYKNRLKSLISQQREVGAEVERARIVDKKNTKLTASVEK